MSLPLSAPIARPLASPFGAPARPVPSAPRAGYASQANRYREAELASASPGQLVVMLFDRIVLTLRRARVFLEQRDIEQRTEQIVKAQEMISELRMSLDFEQGGEIAGQLDALYAYSLRTLLEANREQSAEKIDVVVKIVSELREAFAQIVAGTAAAAAPAGAPTGAPAARSA